MTEIIIIRHGETEWNVAEIFRGRMDIELNETGIKQAKLLAGYMSKMKINAIYSSPLKRALKTAEIVAEPHKLEVNIAPDLIDFDYGEWQGLSHQEVKDKHKELYATWVSHPEQVRIPAGESLDEVRKRAVKLINSIIAKYSGAVVLISHRVVNKVLICALLGLDDSHFWNIKQDVCGITTFTYENEQFVLTKHNDISCLESISQASLSDF